MLVYTKNIFTVAFRLKHISAVINIKHIYRWILSLIRGGNSEDPDQKALSEAE